MFKSVVLKLTGRYLVIIMALSIGFSLFLYKVYTDELNRTQYLQGTFFNTAFPGGLPGFDAFNQSQSAETRERLFSNLILFNLVVLIGGCTGGYVLARRTLRPIRDAFVAQSRFVADASHELRTPLTAMQTEIEVALRDNQLTLPDAQALLRSNLEEVAKLRDLSNNLLGLARQDRGGISMTKISLRTIADDALRQITPLLRQKNIHAENLVEPLTIKGNLSSLTELLVILLDNAIKYSSSDSQVKVSTRRQGAMVSLAVTDHGIGISPEALPHIFDRFYRADQSRSKAKASGYGLGLSIAKEIISAHHGDIKVHSIVGKGSTFVITLPLAQA